MMAILIFSYYKLSEGKALVKTYRTVQQWDHWLMQNLGQSLLAAEKKFLSGLLAERYGKHVLLMGVPGQRELIDCSVMSNRVILTPLLNRHKEYKCIESNYYSLPIAPGTLDLVIVPHTLELLDNPRQLLAEACRAVKPEGLIVLLGFNPISFWGLKKWWVKSKKMPWVGTFIHANKVKNWLRLADFELVKHDTIFFRPPIASKKIFQRLRFLEWVGKKLYAPLGGVYILTAQAKIIPLTPIKLHWKQTISPLHAVIPGPTMRDIQ
jgi:SAM-dependent methyltransferase